VTVVDTTPPTLVCAPDKQVECTAPWTFDPPHASDTGLGMVTVYDNSVNDAGARFATGTNEVGNEILLAGTERYLQRFAFEYWGTNTGGGGFVGAVQARLRLRANDGLWYSGYQTPGTVLYDSGNFPVPATPRSTVVFDEFDLWVGGLVPLSGALPDNLTWTVEFSGLGVGDEVGLDIYEPPVVGQAYGDYWILTNGNWELRDSLTVEYDFAALAKASGTNVTITVLSTVTNATCGDTFVATRTWVAMDACGNTNTCSQTVTVVDTTLPSITCPPTVVVAADAGQCYATGVALGTPTAGDTCGSVTVSNNAPALFPLGTNIVVWTAVDACGNIATCNQEVVVQDLQPPVLVAGAIASCYTSAALAEAAAIAATTISENCTVTNISAATVGTCSATVTVTVTDGSGNSTATNYSTRIDGVAPVIGTVTATQDQGGSPVNVKDQTCAVAPVLQGVVTFTVDASDNCSLAGGQPTLTLTNGTNTVVASLSGVSGTTYTFTWTVTSLTANGTWYATVAASDLCTTTTDNFTVCVNQSQITGLVQLEGFVGTGTVPLHSRVVTFVMSGGASTVTNSLLLTNVSGDTFNYTLVNVPAGTTAVSAKTDWNLREKLPVVFDVNNQAVADFVSDGTPGWNDATDHYLRGGDIDPTHNNQISFLDYSVLGNNYFTANPVADINGSGLVNLADYSILAANWFTFGDPQ
jgi:hypothetical protein